MQGEYQENSTQRFKVL